MNDEFNANFDRTIPKYVLCPGFVYSRNDGHRHFINAITLAELYHVPMNECVVKPNIHDPRNMHWYPPQTAIELRPKSDGNYKIFREIE